MTAGFDLQAIFEALQTKWETSTLPASTQGLWPYEADQDTHTPYVTMILVSDIPDWAFSSNYEEALIQFSVWVHDNDPDNSEDENKTSPLALVNSLAKSLTALFDEASITVAGYYTIRMSRESMNLIRDPDWRGYAYHVTYRILLQEV